MRPHLVCVVVFATFVSNEQPTARPLSPGVSMAEVEACRIDLTPIGKVPKWGGQAAVYDLRTDDAGAVLSMTRRVIPDREHLPPLVRLDQFESCVRRWRFSGGATYEAVLVGGTTSEGSWMVEIRQGDRKFRLRIPR